jgi:hypothetical protein
VIVLLREVWSVARPIRIVVGSLLLVVVLAACSGSGEREGEAPASTTGTSQTTSGDGGPTSMSSTTTSAPAGLEDTAVAGALQDLVDRYDEAVAQVLTDPRVAGDAAHPAVLAYTGLFVPGSEFAAGALESWVQLGVQGRFHRPGPRGRMYESTVVEVEVDDATRTATFLVCALVSVAVFDAAGRPVAGEGGQTAGTGVAELVGSEWRLRELTEASPQDCEGRGTGEASS